MKVYPVRAMLSRKVWWSLGLATVAAVIILTRVGTLPSRVTIINQSGVPLRDVALIVNGRRVEVAEVGNGGTRTIAIAATSDLVLFFRDPQPHRWRARDPLVPGQSLVLYVSTGGRVEARGRIGSFAR